MLSGEDLELVGSRVLLEVDHCVCRVVVEGRDESVACIALLPLQALVADSSETRHSVSTPMPFLLRWTAFLENCRLNKSFFLSVAFVQVLHTTI